MTLTDIGRYRLHQQHIIARDLADPAAVVAWLGALQAQDYPGVKWSVGLRLPGTTAADVEQAIADRTIVRTWPMRGTLHFVAPADVRWMVELLAPRIVAGMAGRERQLGLTPAIVARSQELFATALQGGQLLSRTVIQEALEAGGITTAGQRGYHLLARAAMDGLICCGPLQDGQPTFALLSDWAPQARSRERDDALAELARRYFTSHGPATLYDFAWWSGLKVTDARLGLELARPHLTSLSLGTQTYWLSPNTPEPPANPPTLHLLPGFDEFILGYKDRSAVLDPAHAQAICPGGNGMFMPTIIVNGAVAGTWKRTFNAKKTKVTLSAQPFAPLAPDQNLAFAAAAHDYARYLGLEEAVLQ